MARWSGDLMREYGVRLIIGIVILLLAAAGLIVAYNKAKQKQNTSTSVQNPQTTAQLPEIRLSAKTFAPINGWSDGKSIQYYDFSQSSENVGNAYVLVTGFDANNNPIKVADQKDIYDAKRSDADYTDFWRILYVTVPTNYQADSIKSSDDIEKSNWSIKDSGRVENRPQVLNDDKIEPDRPKSGGWVKGDAVYTWTFETNITRNSTDVTKVATGIEYEPVTGYDAAGNPNRVSGQYNIVDTVPGQENYTPARRLVYVEVPADYVANTFKSVDDVKNSKYTTKDAGIVVDNPVYAVDGKVVLPGGAPSTPELARVSPTPTQTKKSTATKGTTSKSPVIAKQIAVALPEASAQTVNQQSANAIACTTVCPVVAGQGIVVPSTQFNITISNQLLSTNNLVVPMVSSVTWTNNDLVPHLITFSNIDVNSSIVPPGGSFTLLFLGPGDFMYYDGLFPQITGVISVR